MRAEYTARDIFNNKFERATLSFRASSVTDTLPDQVPLHNSPNCAALASGNRQYVEQFYPMVAGIQCHPP
jgi:hypothetical protein